MTFVEMLNIVKLVRITDLHSTFANQVCFQVNQPNNWTTKVGFA